MARQLKFPGVPFPAHAPKYILPALGLKEMRANKERLAEFIALEQKMNSPEGRGNMDLLAQALDGALWLVHLALSRNYPDVKVEDIEEYLDMSNFQEVVASIMQAAGFVRVTELPQGVQESGEA